MNSDYLIKRQEAREVVLKQLQREIENISSNRNIDEWLPPEGKLLLDNISTKCGGISTALWIIDETQKFLVPVYCPDPHSSKLLSLRQPVNEGIVSMVFHSEQSFLENDVQKSSFYSNIADKSLDFVTNAEMVVPFRLLGDIRGVISCVILSSKENALKLQSFSMESLVSMEKMSALLETLTVYNLIRKILGI